MGEDRSGHPHDPTSSPIISRRMASPPVPPCGVCGAPARAGARFCGECGAAIGVSAPPAKPDAPVSVRRGPPAPPPAKPPPPSFKPPPPPSFKPPPPSFKPPPAAKPPPPIKAPPSSVRIAGPRGTEAPPPPAPDPNDPKARPRRKREARTLTGVDPDPTGPDPQAPTDPALVLGLGPAGAVLPPIEIPAPPPVDDEDDDDQPTQTRTAPQAAALGAARVSTPPSTGEKRGEEKTEFQRLLEEVEDGFDSILLDEGAASMGGQASTDFDALEVRQLFDQIAVAHARPVRDFMFEIKLGEPPKAWIAFCRPAVKALERSARGMELGELADALDSFAAALDLAEEKSATALVRDQARQMVIDAYSDLIARMPEAFALEAESNRRETLIVHALLAQVPGLHPVGMDRLYETGMTSLALFYVARPEDLMESAHVEAPVARRIVERFAAYRREATELSPDDGRAQELARVEALCEVLERTAEAYEEASASWSSASTSRRKELRRSRTDAIAQLRLLLARLGELDLLGRVEALPSLAKVAALRAFVEEARRGWRHPPESVHRSPENARKA